MLTFSTWCLDRGLHSGVYASVTWGHSVPKPAQFWSVSRHSQTAQCRTSLRTQAPIIFSYDILQELLFNLVCLGCSVIYASDSLFTLLAVVIPQAMCIPPSLLPSSLEDRLLNLSKPLCIIFWYFHCHQFNKQKFHFFFFASSKGIT